MRKIKLLNQYAKLSIITTIFLLIILTVFGCDESNPADSPYMATTEWVAGFIEVAGIDNVNSFAPSDMKHPPEYELKPDDIARLDKAEYVFYAGYEQKMVEKIKEALKSEDKDFNIIQVKTENSLDNIKTQALSIAKKLNTVDQYNKNINEIESAFNRFKDMLKDKGFYGKTAYVHTFQVPIIKSLGFNIAGTFGPAPVNAEKIQEVSRLKPDFIIDNVHNEVAQPLLEESPDSLYVSFLNFPGLFNTETLLDVIKYNEEALKKTVTNK